MSYHMYGSVMVGSNKQYAALECDPPHGRLYRHRNVPHLEARKESCDDFGLKLGPLVSKA